MTANAMVTTKKGSPSLQPPYLSPALQACQISGDIVRLAKVSTAITTVLRRANWGVATHEVAIDRIAMRTPDPVE
jgi:hypothetical protein